MEAKTQELFLCRYSARISHCVWYERAGPNAVFAIGRARLGNDATELTDLCKRSSPQALKEMRAADDHQPYDYRPV